MVPTIRRYVTVGSASIGPTVMERASPDEIWRTTILTQDDTPRMPDIGIEVPVADIYSGITFPDTDAAIG